MGRWRPPGKPGSPYITAAGYLRLEEELKALWVKRREVVAALSAAAAEGDRSENAEYIYRKKELGGIDRRIRYLQKRIPDLEIVRHETAPDRVFFGARVLLETNEGHEFRYRIVGQDEADPKNGDINIDSPLARSLLKRTVGDEVSVRAGEAVTLAWIEAIDYDVED